MTQPPQASGQSNAPNSPAGSHSAVSSAEFGAPTISGTRRGEVPVGVNTSSHSGAYGSTSTAAGHAATRAAAPPEPPASIAPTVTRASRAARERGPRRARLQIRHVNPWTVLKFSCVLAIALFFVWLIVVGVLFGVLDAAGVIGKINDTVTTINGPGSNAPITAGVVFGGAAIIGVINIILFIALSTVGSVIYNLCADLVGGIEVTLSER